MDETETRVLAARLEALEGEVAALRDALGAFRREGGAAPGRPATAAALEGRVAAVEQALRDMDGGDAGFQTPEGGSGFKVNEIPDAPPNAPFSIRWEPGERQWKIYVPDGSVYYGGERAEWGGGSRSGDGEAEITEANVYLHVWTESGTYKFSVDNNETRQKALVDALAAEFADGGVAVQHVKGTAFMGGAGGEAVEGAGCYELVFDENSKKTNFANCYYKFGNEVKEGPDGGTGGADSYAGEVVALKIDTSGGSGGATLQGYGSIGALIEDSKDPDYVVVPLYELGEEEVEEEPEEEGATPVTYTKTVVKADLRVMPSAQVVEVLESGGGTAAS